MRKELIEKLKKWCEAKDSRYSRFGVECVAGNYCYTYRCDSSNPRRQKINEFRNDEQIEEFLLQSEKNEEIFAGEQERVDSIMRS